MSVTGTYSKRQVVRGKNRPLEEFQLDKKKRRRRKISVKAGKKSVSLPAIKGVLSYVIIGSVVIGLLGLANNYQQNIRCRDLNIAIQSSDAEDNHFMGMKEVQAILGISPEQPLIGQKMSEIDLNALEATLKEDPTIQNAEVYKNLQGILSIEVEVRSPVARLVNNDGSYLYMDQQGNKFPVSSNHSAHVMLVRGNFDEPLMPVDSFACSTIGDALPVINYMLDNSFWDAQISEIFIKQSGELMLYPQVGDMYIEFGHPVYIEEKFEKLKLFYEQVIQEVGWKKYRGINLKYKGQVVAKKRR